MTTKTNWAGCWLAGALLLGGCAKVQTFGENFNAAWQDRAVSVAWQADIGSVAPGFALRLVGDNVCIGNSSGDIYHIHPADGSIAERISSGIALSSGGACTASRYVGITGLATAVGLDMRNGTQRWQAQLSGLLISAPQLAGNTALLFFANGTVAAYALASGDELWRIELPSSAFRFASQLKPAVVDNTLYFGQPEGALYAVDILDGFILWEARLFDTRSPDSTSNLSALGSPVVAEGRVCASAFAGKTGCFDAGRGAPVWTSSTSSGGSLASAGGTIFLIDAAGSLTALDAADGVQQWSAGQASADRSPLLEYHEGYVVVEDGFAGVSLYAPSTGVREGGIRLDGEVMDMLSVNDTLVVLTSNGRLYGLELGG